MSTTTPYLEVFGCRLATEDSCEHDGDCDWDWSCGTCGRSLAGGPCPDHAPVDIPGLMLAECTAEPPHPRTWVLANEWCGAPCMYCAYEALRAEHAPCEHSRHWPWRRWKVTHKALYRLRLAGVVSGGWTGYSEHCNGCVSHLKLGGSSYVLGWPKWKWSCVFQGRHWPGVEVYGGICGKCSPCPGCESVTCEHRKNCPVGAW